MGTLPDFVKPLGLDIIIALDGRPVLIELQSGFGRRGLIALLPAANALYRKTLRCLREDLGRDLFLARQMRRICGDKIRTYRLFSRYQPASFAFRGWGGAARRWLDRIKPGFVLAKPPRGCCGKGILVFERDSLRTRPDLLPPGRSYLLQEHLDSKRFNDDEGRPHAGCMRHIVLLQGQEGRLNFMHLPSYWRVSPIPIGDERRQESLIANISRGGYPLIADEGDAAPARRLAEQVAMDLVRHIMQIPDLRRDRSLVIGQRASRISPIASQ